MSKGIRFTDEFKRDAVAQVVERGYAVSEVAYRAVCHRPTYRSELMKLCDRCGLCQIKPLMT